MSTHKKTPLKRAHGNNQLQDEFECEQTQEYLQEDDTMDLGDFQSHWDTEMEACVRDEVQSWLAQHGSKLFSLESSKFLAKPARLQSSRK